MALLDYGLRDGYGLSYSRLGTLHACPRKFQIENIFAKAVRTDSTTFSFGHAVGAGVQELIEHGDLNKALMAVMANWAVGMFEEEVRAKKSLFYAVRATEKFHELIKDPATNILKDYEIARFDIWDEELEEYVNKPAVELTFNIICGDGYEFEGHVDLILKEKASNKYMILELKTTSFTTLNSAMYKNSSQAVGYGTVLDSIAAQVGGTSSYSVLYLIYKSGKMEFEPMVFPKSSIERAKWINSLILDIEVLKMYREYNSFPARGESCYNFFRPCEYFETCGMSDEVLDNSGSEEEGEVFSKLTKHDFTYDLQELIDNQTSRLEGTGNINSIELGGEGEY